jgi:hypothetical protein
MRKIFFFLITFCSLLFSSQAQKIVPIEFNGQKYEVLDMTAKGKIMWGGYEEIMLDAAKSDANGSSNTIAICLAVGKNAGFEGKPYAAKLCSEAVAGDKDDWYLPAKEEIDAVYENKAKFNFEERGSLWTSTEANGTQAVTKYLYNGTFYNNQKVEEYHFVCFRKVK